MNLLIEKRSQRRDLKDYVNLDTTTTGVYGNKECVRGDFPSVTLNLVSLT